MEIHIPKHMEKSPRVVTEREMGGGGRLLHSLMTHDMEEQPGREGTGALHRDHRSRGMHLRSKTTTRGTTTWT